MLGVIPSFFHGPRGKPFIKRLLFRGRLAGGISYYYYYYYY